MHKLIADPLIFSLEHYDAILITASVLSLLTFARLFYSKITHIETTITEILQRLSRLEAILNGSKTNHR